MPYKRTGRPPGRPKQPLDERMWRALSVEVAGFDPDRRPWPSRAKVVEVAEAAGVSPRAIRKRRRKCRFYFYAFDYLLRFREERRKSDAVNSAFAAASTAIAKKAKVSPILEKFRQTIKQPDENSKDWSYEIPDFTQLWDSWSEAERRGYVLRWLCQAPQRWPGQFSEDGIIFPDPESYVDHMIEAGAIPWPHSIPVPVGVRFRFLYASPIPSEHLAVIWTAPSVNQRKWVLKCHLAQRRRSPPSALRS